MIYRLCNNIIYTTQKMIGDYEKKEEGKKREGKKRERKEDRTRTKEEKISYLCETEIL